MVTSTSAISGTSGADLLPEEFGYLMGGPGRAAEVAVVRLVEAGAIRISSQGLVSAVSTHRWGASSPLEASVLGSLGNGSRLLGGLIGTAAGSEQARALRHHLVGRGLLVSKARRLACGWGRFLALLMIPLAFAGAVFERVDTDTLIIAVIAALLGRYLIGKLRGPLTFRGRRSMRRAGVNVGDRPSIVAQHGLLGRYGSRHDKVVVWEMLGISPEAAATLRLRRRRPDDGGSGCSGSSCGSSGCGSSSSCGSGGDSSSGSSCGGGGGGCGGGGGD